ncbi:MAG: hypothetical protein A2X12_11865 [Bacteroidetes bacterium GWE2_29_8]|nr:MAG: hypothetical protein A2X12_11865 [Bacteroidetes bacterium GWE2_29_8]OFY22156.1 MAG: hypothetical protein A2X02_00330 [Bacteroidetes bacterium GWF2_29_10]
MDNKYKILVIDNDKDSVNLIKEYLTDVDFELFIDYTGLKAIEIAKIIDLDLILMNNVLPKTDVYEICKRIKSNDLFASLPIIFIISEQELFDKSYSYSIGVSDYILKPIEKQELIKKITTYITISSLKKQLNQKNKHYNEDNYKQTHDLMRANEYLKSINRELIEKTIQLKHTESRILNAIIQTQEEERTRFAKDIHDGIGPILSIVKNNIEWLNSPNTHTDKEFILNTSLESINIALKTLKEISNNLSPHILENIGLISALNTFIENIIVKEKIKINLENNLTNRLSKDFEINLYRILIECLNNSLKYSKADKININIIKNRQDLLIEYYDNGIGFDYKVKTFNKGMGLINIENRVKVMKGKIIIKTSHGKGFYLSIII